MDVVDKKSKSVTLYYRRASWDFQEDHKSTLESHLKASHEQLLKAEDRTFDLRENKKVSGVEIDGSDGFFAHIVLYSPNASTSIIGSDLSQAKSEVSEEPAPVGADYVKAAVFVLVKDNHVIVCPADTRDATAQKYFYLTIKKAGYHQSINNFKLDKIANTNVVKMIRDQGVSELILDSSLYEASLQRMDSTVLSVLGGVANYATSAFKKDTRLAEIEKDESVNVKVSFRFDKRGLAANRKRNNQYGESGKERLKASALQVFESGETEGFKIKTFGGNTISAGSIGVSDKFTVDISGSTLCKHSALECLREYYQRLKDDGILEQ